MKLSVLPEAELEATGAATWYEDRRPGLGGQFVDELTYARDGILKAPWQWPRVEFYEGRDDVRRCFVYGFPYSVIFLQRPGAVVVVAVCHTRRHPLYWLERLAEGT